MGTTMRDHSLIKEGDHLLVGLNDLVKVEKSCPHEDHTQRENIAQLLKQVEDLHGLGLFNIFKSMNKIFEEYLPVKDQTSSSPQWQDPI